MNRILCITALAAAATLGTACQTSPEVGTETQALADCLPQGNFCGTLGQPLPVDKEWKVGDPVPWIPAGALVIIEGDGNGTYTATGIEWQQQKAHFRVHFGIGGLGPFVDSMTLASAGTLVRPYPLPNPPDPGEELMRFLELAYRVDEGIANAIPSGDVCIP